MKDGGLVTRTGVSESGDLQVQVLGEFRVRRNGHETGARTRQVGRVGSLLAARPGIPVPRDYMIDVLWKGKPPSTAINTLQVHVSQLRSLTGKEVVLTHGDAYLLAIDPDHVDAEYFKQQILECLGEIGEGDAESIHSRLQAALALWRADPYVDLYSPEIDALRSELTELRERAIEASLGLSLAVADSPRALATVIAAAKGQVARQPLREAGYEVLIRALVADGRPVEAGDAYRGAVDFFQVSLGVEPSERLHSAVSPVLTIVN